MEQSEDGPGFVNRAEVAGMTEEAAHEFLMDENERRVRRIFVNSAGAVDLENAFDFTKVAVYVTHICLDLGILDRADLDFQGVKANMLDEIEKQYDEAMRSKEAEVARSKLKSAGFKTGPSPEHPTMRVIRPEADDPA